MDTLKNRICPTTSWRQFWSVKSRELAAEGFSVCVGDEWVVVRDESGSLVEQITVGTTELTIEARLVALSLDRDLAAVSAV